MTKFKIELDRQYQGQDFNPEIKTVFKWIDTADYNQALIEAGRLAEDPRNSNPRIIEMVTDDGNRFNVYSAEVIKGKVAGLKANFKKHNKKADKLGALHSWIETGTERTVKYYHPDDTLQLYPMVKVYQQITIYYQVPRIEGWILTARFEIEDAPGKIDETGQASPMQTDVFTYTAPGETLPASYQDKTAIECQHCGHNRFRKKSYLLRNLESGEFKEVGSTCLIDFFGHDPKAFVFAAMFDPERFISEAAEDYDEYSHPAGPYGIFYDITDFLTISAACIDAYGWTSRSQAYDDPYNSSVPTANTALDLIGNWHKIDADKKPDVTESHKQLAKDATKYFETLDPNGSDYLSNCQKIARRSYVSPATAGYAASMIISYRKHLERELERKEKESRPDSEFIGAIKQRITVNAKCIFKTVCDSYYGTSELYIFLTDEGAKIKTFYSGNAWKMEQGETADITGTVKKHETYKGEKTTVLNRTKAINIKVA